MVNPTPGISDTINVMVNDQSLSVPANSTVSDLLPQLDLRGGPVAVEKNGDLVPSAEFPSTSLADGDRLEIASLTGGG